jgi:hypothetical protein
MRIEIHEDNQGLGDTFGGLSLLQRVERKICSGYRKLQDPVLQQAGKVFDSILPLNV